MDHLFWNKVFASVIGGALLLMVISTFSEVLFPAHHGEKLAYTVEVAAVGTTAAAVEVKGPSLSELLATADAKKGKRAFAACKSCHTADKGGKHGTGPNLFGIMGRAVGGNAGFSKYSSSLSDNGGTWDYATMDHWLTSPKKAIPGNNMAYAGIRKAPKRADLIAYLRSLSDEPLALPAVVTE